MYVRVSEDICYMYVSLLCVCVCEFTMCMCMYYYLTFKLLLCSSFTWTFSVRFPLDDIYQC